MARFWRFLRAAGDAGFSVDLEILKCSWLIPTFEPPCWTKDTAVWALRGLGVEVWALAAYMAPRPEVWGVACHVLGRMGAAWPEDWG